MVVFKPARELNLTVFSDSDRGDNVDDPKSTCSHCLFLGYNLIVLSSKKQHSVAKPTVEVEY